MKGRNRTSTNEAVCGVKPTLTIHQPFHFFILISPTIVRPKVTIGIGKANIETYYFQGLTLWYPTRTPYLQTWQVPHGAACDIDAWTLLTLLAKRTSFEGLTVEVRYLENINMLCLLLISTHYEPTMVCLSD